MNEWIHVSQRLPDPLTDVLVWMETADGPVMLMAYRTTVGDWLISGALDRIAMPDITWWRPLPAPPAPMVQ